MPHIVNKTGIMYYYPSVRKVMSQESVLSRAVATTGVCLNVNIPASNPAPTEMRITKACKGRWTDEYQEYTDPNGRKFYWLTGKFKNEEPDNEDTDEWCLSHGIVSVVATALDRTDSCDITFLTEG